MNAPSLDELAPFSVSFAELSIACAMSVAELQELVDYGALQPVDATQAEPAFAISYLEPLRTAGKLRVDYDLDLFVVVIVMDYLNRIEQLETQLRSLQAQSMSAH